MDAAFVLDFDDLHLHGPTERVLRLTRLEMRLLWYLAAQEGREVSKAELLDQVWRYAPSTSTHTVQTHIWRLRRKIAGTFPEVSVIRTGPGGYAIASQVTWTGTLPTPG
ncbi:MAG: helix-turn-helix domain-containing protein [Pseudomonadota bacterium]